jgi:hypothetical protein
LGPFKVHLIEQIHSSRPVRDFGGQEYASTLSNVVVLLPHMALRADNRCRNWRDHFSDWVVHGQTAGSKKHQADVVLNWISGVTLITAEVSFDT